MAGRKCRPKKSPEKGNGYPLNLSKKNNPCKLFGAQREEPGTSVECRPYQKEIAVGGMTQRESRRNPNAGAMILGDAESKKLTP